VPHIDQPPFHHHALGFCASEPGQDQIKEQVAGEAAREK
jgi:hypothetical protein